MERCTKMEKTKTNGEDSAFPWIDSLGSESEGLTKREYFAAAAMLPIKAQPNEHGWFERWGNR